MTIKVVVPIKINIKCIWHEPLWAQIITEFANIVLTFIGKCSRTYIVNREEKRFSILPKKLWNFLMDVAEWCLMKTMNSMTKTYDVDVK